MRRSSRGLRTDDGNGVRRGVIRCTGRSRDSPTSPLMPFETFDRGLLDAAVTNRDCPSLNKRTLLGVQCWLVGAIGSLTPENLSLAAALTAVGAYLVFGPSLARGRVAGTSKFLLWAE